MTASDLTSDGTVIARALAALVSAWPLRRAPPGAAPRALVRST